MFKKVLIGLCIFAAIFTVLIFSGKIPTGNSSNAPTGNVTIWGTVPEDTMTILLQSYNTKAKTYRVDYKEIPETIFISRLVEALANGNGPDMILAPYQIILSQSSKLYTYPLASVSEKTYKDTYVDGASIFWTPNGAMAFPVSIEPLVLFYNRTLLSKHSIISPPVYWDELNNIVPKLTVRDSQGGFLESAIAFGAWGNIPYVKDILIAIVNQLGQLPVLVQHSNNGIVYKVTINSPVSDKTDILPLTTAVSFFTGFSDSTKSIYTWNQMLPSAVDAFVAEKLAMYIGYSGELYSIRSSNQKADVDMTYLPQTRGYNTFVTGMRMYGLATLAHSSNPQAALVTESTLAGNDWSQNIAGSLRAISPLRVAVAAPSLNEVISRSALVARGWPDVYFSSTNDLFSQMLGDISTGRSLVTEAVDRFVSRFVNLYTGVK